MANYLHSKDKRRIINALFKFFKVSAANYIQHKQDHENKEENEAEQINSKVKAVRESELAYSQASQKLRYLPILIQIRADEPVLQDRIDKRITKMVFGSERGLQEAFDVFHMFDA